MDTPELSIFSPAFLHRASVREESSSAAPEATWAGPWHIAPHGEKYAVFREGAAPAAIASFRETALLLAAVFPFCGRGPLYWLGRGADGPTLETILGEQGLSAVAKLRHHVDELLVPLSTAEYFLRSPSSLSLLLEAAPVETLRRAGGELARRLLQEQNAAEPACRA